MAASLEYQESKYPSELLDRSFEKTQISGRMALSLRIFLLLALVFISDARALASRSTNAFPMKQVQITYSCKDIDSDEISELLLEIGTLSVSVEGLGLKEGFLNEEKNWKDIQSKKSWKHALLRANFPSTYDETDLIALVHQSFPDVNMEIKVICYLLESTAQSLHMPSIAS